MSPKGRTQTGYQVVNEREGGVTIGCLGKTSFSLPAMDRTEAEHVRQTEIDKTGAGPEEVKLKPIEGAKFVGEGKYRGFARQLRPDLES